MSHPEICTVLRIPGDWSGLDQLVERIPEGFELSDAGLTMPDGTIVEVFFYPRDSQFTSIFRTACRTPLSPTEEATLDRYSCNVCLSGSGGSSEKALRMLQAGAAIVRAGGAGVFIDNSALSHGGQGWMDMADDGSADAISFAYVSIIHSKSQVYSMGMHILGHPDLVLNRSDLDVDGETMTTMIRYMSESDKPIESGHVIADLNGPRFQAIAVANKDVGNDSPMFNPFGRLQLVSTREIAENN